MDFSKLKFNIKILSWKLQKNYHMLRKVLKESNIHKSIKKLFKIK